MSFYNENIRSRQFVAVRSDNKVCQIDLDEGIYLANAVLAITPTLAGTGAAGLLFTVNGGAFSCIQSLELRAGNQIITQNQDVANIAAFFNTLQDNGDNASKNKTVYGTSAGYEVSQDDFRVNATYVTTKSTTYYLQLNKVLRFLHSSKYLNTHKLKNLNLVIKFRSDVRNWFQGNVNANVTCDFQQTKPSIFIDELLKGKGYDVARAMTSKSKVLEFFEIQKDNISVCQQEMLE